MEACKLGFEVAAEMLETELVFSSCGSLVKGTPDGGFRDAEGLLRLVQVVRVPLLEHMDEDEAADCLYNTVLAKIVKSQVWMKETGTLPHDFVIFCWLPPVGAYRACLENTDALLWTEALLWNVRAGGWPFSLVVRVPEQPGRVFPRNFGFRNYRKEQHNPAAELSYFLNPTDFEDDDDEMLFGWDVFVEEEDATVIEEEDVQVLALVRRAIALIERANLAEAAPAEEASDNLSEGAQRNHAADLASRFRIHYARCREPRVSLQALGQSQAWGLQALQGEKISPKPKASRDMPKACCTATFSRCGPLEAQEMGVLTLCQ
ncbi:unnamed protein product [Effrenium voratum]|uniref:Uncharacterized protein n=1 Tax=Effrenium voratum TaxID=2562239 RepID=A0AA36MVV8_9DINO|nr:unnamed protein product [Effrenium voratum]